MFPAVYCAHIESVFATVRHRTVRTKGALSQKTAKLMVFTLILVAAKKWLRLKGRNQLPKVIEGITVKDGAEPSRAEPSRPAAPQTAPPESVRHPNSTIALTLDMDSSVSLTHGSRKETAWNSRFDYSPRRMCCT